MRVRTLCAAIATTAASSFVSFPAVADCAPGDWFCDEAKEKPGHEGDAKKGEKPPPSTPSATPPSEGPPSGGDEKAAPSGKAPEGKSHAWPPVVHEPSHKVKTATPSKRPAPKKRFGINGHANLVLAGNDPQAEPTSLQGPGVAFRFRPVPLLGIDSGLDLVGGHDWNGNERLETALVVNALLFINPKDRLELHVLSGFGLSLAYVREDQPTGETPLRHYWYVGWDLGFGLDFYLTKRVAIGLEALALVRGREDKGRDNPEFVDPQTHRATNISAGGLIRPGVTLYW